MHSRLALLGAFALALASSLSFAAADITYLQNGLDLRGQCLGAEGEHVAMNKCDKSPSQQWVTVRGDIPGYFKLQTVAGGQAACLSASTTTGTDAIHMAPCGKGKDQQWILKGGVPRMMFTNRATGNERCLQAVQTGFKLSTCERSEPGHFWRGSWEPTM
ncbi:RICIN domain-containing protein [Massilia forsythiae]|uniref:RICIN domain-containing protein n=1 Tax=Massilia forsythiae TaxID=2728020 RepID=A0A7Z2VY89_9BURK|nr:RICIN domain-containing protein [Massilia forsythiae]QJE01275.1 RICIN domain-containing protein [Massilia forsythiae]